jgi:hypothetical protein
MTVDPQFRRAPSDAGQVAFTLAVSSLSLKRNTSGVQTIKHDRRLFSYPCTHFLPQLLCFETDAKFPGADPCAPISRWDGPISHLIFKQTNGEAMIPVTKASKRAETRPKPPKSHALDKGFTLWATLVHALDNARPFGHVSERRQRMLTVGRVRHGIESMTRSRKGDLCH